VGDDSFLRRLESTAVIACLAMAVIALALSRGRPGPAAGVLGGGLLIAVSYWTIASGVTALGAATGIARPAPRLAWTVTKVVARYALLALLAYVMIARLRLHPLGLLAGASSVVVAASVEAFRLLLKKS
jgi:hypothetical protein